MNVIRVSTNLQATFHGIYRWHIHTKTKEDVLSQFHNGKIVRLKYLATFKKNCVSIINDKSTIFHISLIMPGWIWNWMIWAIPIKNYSSILNVIFDHNQLLHKQRSKSFLLKLNLKRRYLTLHKYEGNSENMVLPLIMKLLWKKKHTKF